MNEEKYSIKVSGQFERLKSTVSGLSENPPQEPTINDPFVQDYLLAPTELMWTLEYMSETDTFDLDALDTALEIYAPVMTEYARALKVPTTPIKDVRRVSELSELFSGATYTRRQADIVGKYKRDNENTECTKCLSKLTTYYTNLARECVRENIQTVPETTQPREEAKPARKDRRKKRTVRDTTVGALVSTVYNIEFASYARGDLHAARLVNGMLFNGHLLDRERFDSELMNLLVSALPTIVEEFSGIFNTLKKDRKYEGYDMINEFTETSDLLMTENLHRVIARYPYLKAATRRLRGIFMDRQLSVLLGIYRVSLALPESFIRPRILGETKGEIPRALSSDWLHVIQGMEQHARPASNEYLSAHILSTYPDTKRVTPTDKAEMEKFLADREAVVNQMRDGLLAIFEHFDQKRAHGSENELARAYSDFAGQIAEFAIVIPFSQLVSATETEFDENRLAVELLHRLLIQDGIASVSYAGDLFRAEGTHPNPYLLDRNLTAVRIDSAPILCPELPDGYLLTMEFAELGDRSVTFYLNESNVLYMTSFGLIDGEGVTLTEVNVPQAYQDYLRRFLLEHVASVRLGRKSERRPKNRQLPSVDRVERKKSEDKDYGVYHIQGQEKRAKYTESDLWRFAEVLDLKGYHYSEILTRYRELVGIHNEGIDSLIRGYLSTEVSNTREDAKPKETLDEQGQLVMTAAIPRYSQEEHGEFAKLLLKIAENYIKMTIDSAKDGIDGTYITVEEQEKVIDSVLLRLLMTDLTMKAVIDKATERGKLQQIHLHSIYDLETECREVSMVRDSN